MIFKYKAFDKRGEQIYGTIEANNLDSAISSIQRRDLVVLSIIPEENKGLFSKNISFLERVKMREIVLLSRQLSTLFGAQVSALRIFRLLGSESDNPALRSHLTEVADDLQAGLSIHKALSKHPKLFSDFYVNMVKAGEESGKLDQTFLFLADNLERTYALLSKAKSALIYPIFIIFTFVSVMVLMLTAVIPKLTTILVESGQEIPVYTKIVIAISNFFVNYGIFLLFTLIVGGIFLWRWSRTDKGKDYLSQVSINIPYVGTLYRKLYLARITGNLSTMLSASMPIVKVLEITSDVVDNYVYKKIITETMDAVRGGAQLSSAFAKYPEIPGIMIAMFRVGEETGDMGEILKTMARFYEREVIDAVDSLVGLIEPVMVVALGLGVGFLLASVLIPIYNVSMAAGVS
jgi:type II secretory pathway component PulF